MTSRFRPLPALKFLLFLPPGLRGGGIDRKAVVERHNIRTGDVSNGLALGNGEFDLGQVGQAGRPGAVREKMAPVALNVR